MWPKAALGKSSGMEEFLLRDPRQESLSGPYWRQAARWAETYMWHWAKILGECFGNALLLQWTESLKLQEWLQGCLWNSIGDRKYSGAEIVLETTYALGCSQEPQGCCCWFICLFLSSAPFWSPCGLASVAYSQRPPPYNITHRGSLLLHPLFNSSFLNFSFYYWLILLAFS